MEQTRQLTQNDLKEILIGARADGEHGNECLAIIDKLAATQCAIENYDMLDESGRRGAVEIMENIRMDLQRITSFVQAAELFTNYLESPELFTGATIAERTVTSY